MNVAFIPNYEKTIFFHKIGRQLEAARHRVFWISPSHHWASWVVANGSPPAQVLDLTSHAPEWLRGAPSARDRQELAALEAGSGLRINDVILMDRILRDRPDDRARHYLAVAARAIQAFLVDRGITLVFGEQTFATELLTGMSCRALGIEMLVPDVVRIPSGRVAFFRGHQQAELAILQDVTEEHRRQASAFHEDFRRRKPRPEYFVKYAKPPTPHTDWPRKLMKHVRLSLTDPHDQTHFSPPWLIKQRVAEVVNALVHRMTRPFTVPPWPPERPFVLYALHKQPEASIDVAGSYFCNQIELVAALARSLPATHDLYVKEHPAGLGDRTYSYLRQMKKIPAVRLVDAGVDTFKMMEASSLVVTITGTVAYEAALLGLRAATVAPMFFGPLLQQNGFNPYGDRLGDLLDRPFVQDQDKIREFLAGVIGQSFPGSVDSPLLAPAVLADENIEAVAAGFLTLMTRCSSHAANRNAL